MSDPMRIAPLSGLLGFMLFIGAPCGYAVADDSTPDAATAPLAADDDGSGGDDSGSGDTSTTKEEDPPPRKAPPPDASEDDGGKRGKKDADPLEERRRKRIIKIVQKKDFLKYHRLELTPTFGLVSNDPFLRRILGGLNIAYHVNELFSVEVFLAGSPNLGKTDLKPLTNQLLTGTEVVPDISRIEFIGVMDFGISPIFGKLELGTLKVITYDLFILAGAGVVYTADDETIITGGDEKYLKQWHLATNFGFGFRIAFTQAFALRLEGRSYIHIEQVDRDALNLEMKNNFAFQIGASFFLPPRKGAK